MRVLQLLIILSTALSLISCGGGNGTPTPSQSYTTADAYIESENFVGTILIKKGGNDVIRKGFGFADKEQKIANDIDTRYRIGSLTKAFTALAIVQLKNANIIESYDDPVSKYIPDYPRGDKISIRHVLTHQSGIPDYLSKVDASSTYTPAELVNLFKNTTLEFEPGQKFNYSNSNYTLLGYLIEILSGQDYESYLQDNIFNSLGMVNTEYGKSTITNEHYAKGYLDALQTQKASFLDMSIPYSSGALSSNIIDMEIWAESFAKNILVSEQDNLEIFSDGDYGFGWVVTKVSGRLSYIHTGAINGFKSIIAIFPEDDSLIIALSNTEENRATLGRIVKAVAEHEL